jgi:branched-subunit amino acid ABC-type transport system permease component
MSQILLFILLGLGPGALIAGLAIGVVLNFRGSGVINMAVGAIAMFAAYVFYGLRTGGYLFLSGLSFGGPMATVPAVVVTLAVCALLGVVIDALIFRPLRGASALAKLVSTLGILLTLQAAVVMRFGEGGQSPPSVLPTSASVHLFGVTVPGDRFMMAGIVVLATLLLAAAYRWTRFGLATRAASENETVAVTSGLSPARLSMINTVLMTLMAGGFGILVAPLTQLDSVTIALAIVPALAAALLARFTSFGIALIAGLAMGAIQSLLLYVQAQSWFPTVGGGAQIPGVSDVVFFLIIVAAMFWRGSSLPERGAIVERRLPAAPAARRIAVPVSVLTALAVLGFLVFPYDFRQALINTLIGALFCLSYVVITGFVGQMSLVQVALGGVCAFVVSKLALHTGIGFPLGPLIGTVVAMIFGLLTAVSALRVRGVQLAVVTMAAAVAIENFGFSNPSWGAGPAGSLVPSPNLLGVGLGPSAGFSLGDGQLPSPVFGFVCLIVVVAVALMVLTLRRSLVGQQMLAVRSNERAAAAAGISVRNVKLTAFAVSSMIAGLGGGLYAYNFGSVTAAQFGIVMALGFIAFAYLGGITTVSGALIGGLFVTEGLGFHAVVKWTGMPNSWELMFGGLALIITVVTHPDGVASVVQRAGRRMGPRLMLRSRAAAPAAAMRVEKT